MKKNVNFSIGQGWKMFKEREKGAKVSISDVFLLQSNMPSLSVKSAMRCLFI